jgi:hypothetical protein
MQQFNFNFKIILNEGEVVNKVALKMEVSVQSDTSMQQDGMVWYLQGRVSHALRPLCGSLCIPY